MTNAREIGFRLGYSFRASTATEGHGNVCHNTTVWPMRTLKYSHQPEEPEVFILLPTVKSLRFMISFTKVVIFPYSTGQHEVRNR